MGKISQRCRPGVMNGRCAGSGDKDSSKEGGNHGDRCVRLLRAGCVPRGQLCDTAVIDAGVSNPGAEAVGESERR